jgi:hypothetical protein
LSRPPHPSPFWPHEKPSCAHVFGVHMGPVGPSPTKLASDSGGGWVLSGPASMDAKMESGALPHETALSALTATITNVQNN